MKPQTVLITGGTTGIGLATARLLAQSSARIIITGNNPVTLEAARKELPSDSIVIKSDNASIGDNKSLGLELGRQVKDLNAVFFNAGIARLSPLDVATPQLFDESFAVNVRGPYFQLQSLLPLLTHPSTVVFNASVLGEIALPMASAYAATKAALISLARTLALELSPRGIRVNSVSPGPIQTPIYGKLGMPAEGLERLEEQMASQSLAKRMGTAEEVAQLVSFLLSNDSSYIIGENLVIDGGMRWA